MLFAVAAGPGVALLFTHTPAMAAPVGNSPEAKIIAGPPPPPPPPPIPVLPPAPQVVPPATPAPAPVPPPTTATTPGGDGTYTALEGYYNWALSGVPPNYLTKSGSIPSCLEKILNEILDRCFNGPVPAKYPGAYPQDDCLLFELADAFMVKGEPEKLQFVMGPNWYSTKKVIDSNCNLVRADTPTQGVVSVRSFGSPISLLWKRGAQIGHDFTLVRFALDLHDGEQWVAWEGSKDTPLLVYDPDRKRRVESAADLFGNWTFTRLPLPRDDSASEPPWHNGYEPLATLDLDRDGAIRGAELNPIALWFDENRDGRSDPGEVVGAKEMGITVLYYKPDRVDSATSAIYATRGFERKSGGRRTTGTSVDWFALRADAQLSLLGQLRDGDGGKAFAPGAIERAVALASTPEARARERKAVAAEKRRRSTQFGGAWRWQAEYTGDPRTQPQGYLLLSESGGDLHGFSVVEIPIPDSGGMRKLEMFSVAGRIFTERSGARRAQFAVAEPDGTTSSEATLLQNGSHLKGLTTTDGLPFQGSNISVRYRWTAERVSR